MEAGALRLLLTMGLFLLVPQGVRGRNGRGPPMSRTSIPHVDNMDVNNQYMPLTISGTYNVVLGVSKAGDMSGCVCTEDETVSGGSRSPGKPGTNTGTDVTKMTIADMIKKHQLQMTHQRIQQEFREIKKLEIKNEEFNRTITMEKREIETTRITLTKDLETVREKGREEKTKLESKIELAKSEIETTRITLTKDLATVREKGREEKTKLESKIELTKREIEITKANLTKTYGVVISERKALRDTMEEFKLKCIRQRDDKIRKVQLELAQAKAEIDRHKREALTLRNEVNNVRKEKDLSDREVQKLKGENDRHKEKENTLRNEINTLRKEKDQSDRQVQSLKAELQTAQSKLKKVEMEKKTCESDRKRINAELLGQKKEDRGLTLDKMRLEIDLKRTTALFDLCKKRKRQLLDHVSDLQKENHRLKFIEVNYEKSVKDVKKLKMEITTIKKEKTSLQATLRTIKKEKTSLQATLRKQTTSISDLRVEIKESRDEYETLSTSCTSLEERTEQQLSNLQDQLDVSSAWHIIAHTRTWIHNYEEHIYNTYTEAYTGYVRNWRGHVYFISHPVYLLYVETAKYICKDLGGYLVEIDTRAEFRFVIKTIVKLEKEYEKDHGKTHTEGTWVGHTDEGHEGKWSLMDSGKNMAKTLSQFWDDGQPDDQRSEKNCMVLNVNSSHKMSNERCINMWKKERRLVRFMCEGKKLW